MGIEVEQTKIVRSDPDIIWDQLEQPGRWSSWWPDCVLARTTDDRQLSEGSRLEVVLKPRTMRVTFHPVVDLLTERKTLSMTHRSALVQSTASWYLQEKPDATVVKAEVVLNGLLPFLVTISQQSSIVRSSLRLNLRGLKKAAERMI